HEALCALESEGTGGDHADLAIEALSARVREARLDVGANPVKMLCNGVCGLEEGSGACALDPLQPVREMEMDVVGRGHVEDGRQALFHQVGLVERMVVSLKVVELASGDGVELPGSTL